MQSTIRSVIVLAAMVGAAIGLSASAISFARPQVPPPARPGPVLPVVAAPAVHDDVTEGIFFAVLEGCYQDGAATELVDAMRANDPKIGYPVNFVYACPI